MDDTLEYTYGAENGCSCRALEIIRYGRNGIDVGYLGDMS